ncbi:lysozyme inhibitor LprI family protein [Martelella mediterranea]|uniref:Uncharacterized protein YecT (DUF1311 family) n=1 Tax=Martelella mediterranea TaxID=293089 RepID=A0A4R3NR57_9HYPH|nr:lysozyme inhibitor LprI family protein [Martelella mediterranea]TCT37639.1 uncharacterized protein YecT (DUF1311 family) [Martelella mediterranea]
MRFFIGVLLLLAGLPLAGAAAADEQVIYSDKLTADCVKAATTASDERACVGLSANACQEASDYGSTTIGMISCLSKEADFWDARLNATYKQLMERAKEADKAAADDPHAIEKVAEKLRDMQRSWIAYRDNRCAYEYSQWQGGTIAGPVSASCALEVTAEQAIYLEGSWPTN